MDTYAQTSFVPAARTATDARARFIRRTYAHLAAAVAGFTALEFYLVNSPLAPRMLAFVAGGQYRWLMVLGAFIVVGWMARGLASKVTSVPAQYAGLILYVTADAVIFLPLLYIAAHYSSPDLIPTAGILTVALFLGLTTIAFVTRKDFSFLGPILMIGGFIALGLILCATVFGFTLGLAFSVGMVVLACGAILYDTSKIIHRFSTNQHVAASLELFASVALLFWYLLRILMIMNRR